MKYKERIIISALTNKIHKNKINELNELNEVNTN